MITTKRSSLSDKQKILWDRIVEYIKFDTLLRRGVEAGIIILDCNIGNTNVFIKNPFSTAVFDIIIDVDYDITVTWSLDGRLDYSIRSFLDKIDKCFDFLATEIFPELKAVLLKYPYLLYNIAINEILSDYNDIGIRNNYHFTSIYNGDGNILLPIDDILIKTSFIKDTIRIRVTHSYSPRSISPIESFEYRAESDLKLKTIDSWVKLYCLIILKYYKNGD